MLTRWHPLNRLHNEMSRLFNVFDEGNDTETVSRNYPLINAWEEEDLLHVEAELPGLALEDVEIFISEGNHLKISGERKARTVEKGTWHMREQGCGKFARELVLPFAVDAELVDAKLENGILSISLPKSESVKPKRIAVKNGK